MSQQLDIDLLQLFITSLEDEDFTKSSFAKSYNNPLATKNSNSVHVDDKVQQICDLLLEQMKGQEALLDLGLFEQIYTVILSCYVKPKSSRVVEALLDLKKHADNCKLLDI